MATRLTQTCAAEVVVEPEIQLTTRQRAELELNLSTYASLKATQADLKRDIDALTGELETLRANIGEKSVGLEGFGKITKVEDSESEKLDVKKLIAQGVTLAIIKKATVKVPRKGHTKITLPGVKDE